ncbi:conserved hypothetical protein [Vibrio owensii]|jgi:hypothetical protein|uniref:hypothetical protein n=1 Tax=Vibrio owensii TaxID=696485 RepID=UPI002896264C|nr:conserved hypothetical protein [Vibrio owensii]CAH1565213.1 conserved hypothetical protein [Vibrio owensii]
MLAFLKRWRQAYLEDRWNRLHAEVEAERNVLCNRKVEDFDAVMSAFSRESNDYDFEQARKDAVRIFPSSKEEREMW